MRGTLIIGAIFALGACGTGVQQVRTVGGEPVYESKCKGSAGECIVDAREKCGAGYEVLDSESHAGGALADVLPGPVTWYTMTFKCSDFASGEPPAFPFRGQRYEPASPPSETATTAPGCRSDFDCGMGRQCIKEQFKYEGSCARVVDQFGTPTYSAPRSDSLGPGGEGECAFDTECPIGFHCIKGNAVRGHCMK